MDPKPSEASTVSHAAAISKALGSFIQSKSAIFACGGSLPIQLPDKEGDNGVALRWDSSNSNSGIAKIHFPLTSDESSLASLQKLVQDCQPASFGYKGEHVLDETYRKATKLDRAAFSVDFCPYERGIIKKVAQCLLPDTKNNAFPDEIKAELYKLNIYAAPSGFFKAHVDTPRSPLQFGSLVISLPVEHKGGQLVVRHADQSVTFDWANSPVSGGAANSVIQWAAFYSDCEHEVLEVTKGHRVTLTYNLYSSPRLEGPLNPPVPEVKSLPLFKYMEAALKEPDFMPAGGYLGIYCQHAYAHTSKDSASSLPDVLKGADMAVFSVLRALGLDVKVRAALDDSHFLRHYLEWFEEDQYYKHGISRTVLPESFTQSFVGSWGKFCVTRAGGEGSSDQEVIEEWGGDMMNVTWVNEPSHKDLEMVHLMYGNDPASINTMYSSAALMVTVPPAEKRGTMISA